MNPSFPWKLLNIGVISAVLSVATADGAATASDSCALEPFSVPLFSAPAEPLDLRSVFDVRRGEGLPRVQVVDGHFSADGQRLRFWGVNLCFGANFPPPEVADQLAARLAGFGINAIRFHHMDMQAFPNGIWKPDFSGLDPRALERLDYFLAALKREGIYANINLLVSRQFHLTGADYPAESIPGQGKAVAIFDPELIKLQKAFARDLLTHINPYTGLRYADDPVIALVEIANENTSFLSLSKHANYLIPEPFATRFQDLWNAFLKNRYKDDEGLLKAWGLQTEFLLHHDASLAKGNIPYFGRVDVEPGRRSEDFVDFLVEVDKRFFLGMYQFLRDEIGVQSLITGTEGFTLPGDFVQSHLDYVDAHGYWQHPIFPDGDWDNTNWHILNTAMVDDPAQSTLLDLTYQRMLNPNRSGEVMPFTVSEFNTCAPNDHQAEGIPMMAAFAAAQDWDGVFLFSYQHDGNWDQAFEDSYFDINGHPLKTIQMAAGALIFRRGDIKPLAQRVITHLPVEKISHLGATYLPWSDTVFHGADLDADVGIRFSGRYAVASWENEETTDTPTVFTPPLSNKDSQTGKVTDRGMVLQNETLRWQTAGRETGQFFAASDHSLVAVGFHLNESGLGEPGYSITVDKPDFAAVTVSPLDGQPLLRSRRMLITTGAQMENTGQTWNAARTSVSAHWGEAPTRIQPVTAHLSLPHAFARQFTLSALGGDGKPLKTWTARPTGNQLDIVLPGNPGTLWYLLEVE